MSKKTTQILSLILLQLKNQNRSYKVSRAPLCNFFYNESERFMNFPPRGNELIKYYLENHHLKTLQL